jgi:hypothetical protein
MQLQFNLHQVTSRDCYHLTLKTFYCNVQVGENHMHLAFNHSIDVNVLWTSNLCIGRPWFFYTPTNPPTIMHLLST